MGGEDVALPQLQRGFGEEVVRAEAYPLGTGQPDDPDGHRPGQPQPAVLGDDKEIHVGVTVRRSNRQRAGDRNETHEGKRSHDHRVADGAWPESCRHGGTPTALLHELLAADGGDQAVDRADDLADAGRPQRLLDFDGLSPDGQVEMDLSPGEWQSKMSAYVAASMIARRTRLSRSEPARTAGWGDSITEGHNAGSR